MRQRYPLRRRSSTGPGAAIKPLFDIMRVQEPSGFGRCCVTGATISSTLRQEDRSAKGLITYGPDGDGSAWHDPDTCSAGSAPAMASVQAHRARIWKRAARGRQRRQVLRLGNINTRVPDAVGRMARVGSALWYTGASANGMARQTPPRWCSTYTFTRSGWTARASRLAHALIPGASVAADITQIGVALPRRHQTGALLRAVLRNKWRPMCLDLSAAGGKPHLMRASALPANERKPGAGATAGAPPADTPARMPRGSRAKIRHPGAAGRGPSRPALAPSLYLRLLACAPGRRGGAMVL